MIILDANAAFAMVIATPEGEALWDFVLRGEKILAPEVMKQELLNVVGKYVRAGLATERAAMSWYEKGVSLVDGFVSMEDARAEILHEATRFGRPVYDMHYLVLARRFNATLFTLDGKLSEICERCGVSNTGVAAF
ncbi:MAG: type II toxin-antitoxin system VapC family toxin [Coriobacteriia bacterium]|nr:type II toxin-antitoxin system VapC family toxin [Coriobacteriia bacterium]